MMTHDEIMGVVATEAHEAVCHKEPKPPPDTITISRELFERLTDAAIGLSMVDRVSVSHIEEHFQYDRIDETVEQAVKLRDEP